MHDSLLDKRRLDQTLGVRLWTHLYDRLRPRNTLLLLNSLPPAIPASSIFNSLPLFTALYNWRT